MHENTLYFQVREIYLILELRKKQCAAGDNFKAGFQTLGQP